MQHIVTKSFAVALVAIFLISPLATPITVDARGGAGAVPKPTASITIGGQKSVTVATGDAIPAIQWHSTKGTKFKTHLMVNNPGLCNGVTDNQGWGQGGNTANGNFKLPNAPKAREGCVMTFVYTVTNRVGQTAVDRATIRYVAPKATTPVVPPVVNPPTNPPVTGGNGGNGTTTNPGTEPLKLLTPNGGEQWMLNSDSTIITWSPNPHADGMVAHLEKKSGPYFTTIGKMVEMKKGSIHWSGELYRTGSTVTSYAEPGSGYYVRILNTKTGETDRSDAPFTIVGVETFAVNLQPANDENILYIDGPTQVRLSWDTTQGVDNVACTLSIFNEQGILQRSTSVGRSGFQDVMVPLPRSTYNGGLYTFAHITCTSPLGTRTDYLSVASSGNTTGSSTPAISITKEGDSDETAGEIINFGYSFANLNVPNDIEIRLYSPILGDVIENDFGDFGVSSASRNGSMLIPAGTPAGEYRLAICDNATESTTSPGKPLCYNDQYFTVGMDNATSTEVYVQPLSETASVDQAEFSGETDKGIYEFEFQVTSDEDIYIEDFVKRQIIETNGATAGFVFDITSNGTPFDGTMTAYIAESTADVVNGKANENYVVRAGTTENFTVRVELETQGASSGQAYGVRLGHMHYQKNFFATTPKRDSIALEQFALPGLDFQTNKVTLDGTASNNTTPVKPIVVDGFAAGALTLRNQTNVNAKVGQEILFFAVHLDFKTEDIRWNYASLPESTCTVTTPTYWASYLRCITKAAGTGNVYAEGVKNGQTYTSNKIAVAITPNGSAGTITPVAQGATGDKVTLVQAALKKAGLFNEEITGYFGSITKAAITAFQRENALDNVGAVGPKTAQLLNQVLAQ
jgi:hypothetical protein